MSKMIPTLARLKRDFLLPSKEILAQKSNQKQNRYVTRVLAVLVPTVPVQVTFFSKEKLR